MVVDFFIVGTQKGGTSALDLYLRSLAGVQMAKIKEVHFFDNDEVDWSAPDYTRLHQCFDWHGADAPFRGEATPIYTYWPHALRRLQRYNPRAKLIMGLRHPSFRAHSQWRMETKRGWETFAFADAIRRVGRRRVENAPNGVHRVFSYVERGFYAAQIDEMLNLFPRNQVLFYRTDALWQEPQVVLDGITAFLGGENCTYIERAYHVPVFAWDTLGISPPDRQFLDTLYADDIERTQRLAGLSLTDWLDKSYTEPMRPD